MKQKVLDSETTQHYILAVVHLPSATASDNITHYYPENFSHIRQPPFRKLFRKMQLYT